MKRSLLTLLVMVLISGCTGGDTENKEIEEAALGQDRPRVVMETTMGRIIVELFPEVAPNHVKSFLNLVNDGFYNGLTFHRVIEGFVIQGGSPDGSSGGHAGFTIPAEFSNLTHVPGTLAMARGHDPNSASSQFYICLSQLEDLDGKYTIFGQTVEGMKVVKKIGEVTTDEETDKPLEPVVMVRLWQEGKEPPEKRK